MTYRLQQPLNPGDEPCAVMLFDAAGRHMLTAPFDPANSDYQEYLEWVAAGNEPTVAQ